MTGTTSNLMETAFPPAGDLPRQIEFIELSELVRGNDQGFLATFEPLVRRQHITLDLGRVQRIDAAGIAALISLHAAAYETRHCFNIVNPTAHVAEILLLVGLESILLSHNTVAKSQFGARHEKPAA